jgi:predicted metal-binding membrane protein
MDAVSSSRDRLLISSVIALITVLAWAYLIHLGHGMSSDVEYKKAMAAMGMAVDTPWTSAEVLFAFAMWAVMMVGMMTPSATPVLVMLFGSAQVTIGRHSALQLVSIFGLGYLAVWAGFSVAAAFSQWALQSIAMLSAAMSVSRPYLAGAILIVAGAYQLTPFKSRCLTHCRSPLGFLMTNWRDGNLGAFRMGLRHGMYCLGCCWALMCLLFVVGVMNLFWVAVLSVFVLLEKAGRAGDTIARIAGVAMIFAGVAEIAWLR